MIDFVGNAGKHKLVTSVDILGGQFPDDVVERAKKIAAATGGKQNVLESLERAQKDIKQEQEEAKRREAARRLEVKVKAEYVTHEVDPFDVLGIQPMRKFGWDTAAPASDKQRALLEKLGKSKPPSFFQSPQRSKQMTLRHLVRPVSRRL